MDPTVSVVIPCYNQGEYLEVAIESILAQTFKNVEIIVVNDGSNDLKTNHLLQNSSFPKTKILWEKNGGLASARNIGIGKSKGKYILPLDADDKIGPSYLKEAIEILEKNATIGIVYCNAQYFGLENGPFDLPTFTKKRLLNRNIIFCSAFFRKSDWEKIGGYNPNMKYGWEDWDFWLSIIELNREVFKIPKTLFFCQKKHHSMLTTMDSYKKMYLQLQIIENHPKLYQDTQSKCLPFLGYSQLFFNLGNGFNESHSTFSFIQSYEEQVEFDLSGYSGIQSLRFDPINDYAEVRVSRIELLFQDSSIETLTPSKHNALLKEENCYLFDNQDPQLIFDTLSTKEISKFRLHLKFCGVGTEPFEKIFRYFRNSKKNKGEGFFKRFIT